MSTQIILPHGGYKSLLTYQKSDIIFRGTAVFTRRFLHHGDRTIGQMVQAARSGKQNIIEGSEDVRMKCCQCENVASGQFQFPIREAA